MGICVEPVDGPELERLVTALLNATGAVSQVIDRQVAAGHGGLAVIDRSAGRLRAILAVVAEHHGDEELRVITEFLAIATMLIAAEEGFADVFGPDGFRAGGTHDRDDLDLDDPGWHADGV